MNIFDVDSPFQRFLCRVADLLVLNIITLFLCIPVITAGAALTAMHYVLLRMVRGEEGYVLRDFFRSFRLNFRQATLMWLIFLAAAFLTVGNLYMIIYTEYPAGVSRPLWLTAAALAVFFLLVMFMTFAFPLMARFTNTVLGTIANAVTLSFAKFARAAAMVLIMFCPVAAACVLRPIIPLVLLFGLSVPGYVCAMLYSPVFRKIEDAGRSDP